MRKKKTFNKKIRMIKYIDIREEGDIGLFITLVPKVLINWLNNLGDFY